MRHHDIDFYNPDDTQLYVSFYLSNPNVALDRMNLCISDLQIWMIRNKLKINDAKTEFLDNYFIVFKAKIWWFKHYGWWQ